jgi:hypothetical protein
MNLRRKVRVNLAILKLSARCFETVNNGLWPSLQAIWNMLMPKNTFDNLAAPSDAIASLNCGLELRLVLPGSSSN